MLMMVEWIFALQRDTAAALWTERDGHEGKDVATIGCLFFSMMDVCHGSCDDLNVGPYTI